MTVYAFSLQFAQGAGGLLRVAGITDDFIESLGFFVMRSGLRTLAQAVVKSGEVEIHFGRVMPVADALSDLERLVVILQRSRNLALLLIHNCQIAVDHGGMRLVTDPRECL